MAKSNGAGETVIIKKYANRRLYDTSTSSYVTLDHLSDLVRREVDFEVVDAKNGEDLTRQVLTQIIFEKENKGEGALPVNFLRKLIGFYGAGSQSLLPAWLEMRMNSISERQERWTKAMGTANPFTMFEKQARANMEALLDGPLPFLLTFWDKSLAPAPGTPAHSERRCEVILKGDQATNAVKAVQAQMATPPVFGAPLPLPAPFEATPGTAYIEARELLRRRVAVVHIGVHGAGGETFLRVDRLPAGMGFGS